MLGDWVQVKHQDGNVDYATINILSLEDFEGDARSAGGQLQAVPLTGEILEANDFEESYDLEYDEAYHFEIRDEKGWTVGEAKLIYDEEEEQKWQGEFFGPNGEIEEFRFNFVHELQHALRLLGIDKEIEVKDTAQ